MMFTKCALIIAITFPLQTYCACFADERTIEKYGQTGDFTRVGDNRNFPDRSLNNESINIAPYKKKVRDEIVRMIHNCGIRAYPAKITVRLTHNGTVAAINMLGANRNTKNAYKQLFRQLKKTKFDELPAKISGDLNVEIHGQDIRKD